MSEEENNIIDTVSNAIKNKINSEIEIHDGDEEAHNDIRQLIDNKANTSSLATVATTGDYDDLDNKPQIPSDLSNYITKSQTTGLVKNDGSIDENTYVTTSDSRLSDARTPTSHTHTKSQISDFPSTMTPSSHTHGDLTNDGKIGSTSGKPIITTTNGKLTTGSFGTSSGQFAEGNHTHSNYLTSHQSLDSKTVTVEKQTTAETGYIATYVVKQNGSQVGSKINIPKDYLVKSATVNTCSTTGTPSGFTKGDKYIDFIVNTKDNSGTDEHIYLNVNDLVDAYTAGAGLELTNSNEIKHSNSITAQTTAVFKKIKYDAQGHVTGTANVEASDLPTHYHSQYLSSHQDISGKEDSSNKVTSWSSTTTDAHYPSEKLVKDSLDGKASSSHTHTKSQITDFPSSMTPSSHTHGNITNAGAIGSASGKPIITTTSGKLTTGAFGTSSGQFAEGNHTHSNYLTSHQDISGKENTSNKSSSITTDTGSTTKYPTVKAVEDYAQPKGNYLTSHQDISGKIDTAGTGLSKSGTTLNHSNSVTAQTSTVFKKVKYDAQGHITGTSDVVKGDITALGIPSSDTTYSTATQSANGLMSSTDKTKLDGIATAANNYTHPTTHDASIIKDSTAHSNIGSSANDTQATINTKIDTALSGKQAAGSYASSDHNHDGVYLKTHQDISGKENSSNKVTSWSSTTTDTHYPSEKLVKTTLDGKVNTSLVTSIIDEGELNQIPNTQAIISELEDYATSDHNHDGVYLKTHQDISGKIDTAGTGLSKSGTTLNHSNSITALTTASLKKIKYDAQGHITGTANVEASDLPSHTHDYSPSNHSHSADNLHYETNSNNSIKEVLDSKIDTAGTGLSKSGKTLNHSNSVTAQTTAAFKKITYDAQGHITGTDDVTASDLPSHTHSDGYSFSFLVGDNSNGISLTKINGIAIITMNNYGKNYSTTMWQTIVSTGLTNRTGQNIYASNGERRFRITSSGNLQMNIETAGTVYTGWAQIIFPYS